MAPILAASWFFVASRAAAETNGQCPAVDGSAPALSQIDARRRLAFVTAAMDDQARRARTWSWAWALTGLGLAASNYTQAAFFEDTFDDRLDPLVGATTSLVIPAAILVDPLAVMKHWRTLEGDLATLSPAESLTGLCDTLARAERWLALSAEDEAFKNGVFTQIFVIAGNGAVALFLGLGFDHWRGALVNGGGGLLISEFQIFTQPTGAVTELLRYRRADLGPAGAAATAWSIHVAPWMTARGAGLSAMGTF
jgi:hypothetical protein